MAPVGKPEVLPSRKKRYQSFGSDEEIVLARKQGCSANRAHPEDERNEWQGKFPWDLEVEMANKEVFGNESFREN